MHSPRRDDGVDDNTVHRNFNRARFHRPVHTSSLELPRERDRGFISRWLGARGRAGLAFRAVAFGWEVCEFCVRQLENVDVTGQRLCGGATAGTGGIEVVARAHVARGFAGLERLLVGPAGPLGIGRAASAALLQRRCPTPLCQGLLWVALPDDVVTAGSFEDIDLSPGGGRIRVRPVVRMEPPAGRDGATARAPPDLEEPSAHAVQTPHGRGGVVIKPGWPARVAFGGASPELQLAVRELDIINAVEQPGGTARPADN